MLLNLEEMETTIKKIKIRDGDDDIMSNYDVRSDHQLDRDEMNASSGRGTK